MANLRIRDLTATTSSALLPTDTIAVDSVAGLSAQKIPISELDLRYLNASSEVDHTQIQNVGTNTHAQIDTHIADSTLHFTESSISHTNILNVGTNTHAQIDSHIASTANPHSVTKTQVGLGNVDNTSDLNKPISTATQTALDLKVNLAGKAGGQTINGGTAAGEGLTLSSTTNATKGKIFFDGTSAYDEVNSRLGVGTTSPTHTIDVVGNMKLSSTMSLGSAATTAIALRVAPTTAITTGALQYGINIATTSDATATTGIVGLSSSVTLDTAAASYTRSIVISNPSLINGATATNVNGLYIADFSALGTTATYGVYNAFSSGTGKYAFYAAGTAANYFGGIVGIGSTSGGPKLHVGGPSSPTTFSNIGNMFSVATATATDQTSSGTVPTATNASISTPTFAAVNPITITNAATFFIGNAPTAGTNVTITNPHALYVASGNSYLGGNLGVGVAAPEGKAHIFAGTAGTVTASANANTLVLESSTNMGISLLSTDTAQAGIYWGTPTANNKGFLLYSHSTNIMEMATNSATGQLRFLTNAYVEAMRIDANGRVGIGTTTPSAKLHVGGTAGVDGIKFPDGTIQTTGFSVASTAEAQSATDDTKVMTPLKSSQQHSYWTNPSAFSFTSWNPSDLAGTATSASALTTPLTNTNLYTIVFSTGVMTMTFINAGKYAIHMNFDTTHSNAYSLSRTTNTIGGTATVAIAPAGAYISWGVAAEAADSHNAATYIVSATAGQTITMNPKIAVTAGGGTTANHTQAANGYVTFLGA